MYWVVLNISAGAETVARGVRTLSRADKPGESYTVEKLANDAAISKAKEHPGQDFAVMAISRVYSTGTPKVVTKICNSQGELVIENKGN